MTHFVNVDKKFRIWVRVTTPSSLISERVNLSANREITDHYDINNNELKRKVLILSIVLDACKSWSLT